MFSCNVLRSTVTVTRELKGQLGIIKMIIRVQLLTLTVLLLLAASIFFIYDSKTGPARRAENRVERKRIPDVVIVGVKKSGTMTLGCCYHHHYYHCHRPIDTFLGHHPNLKVLGEVWYFTQDMKYELGEDFLLSHMPEARSVE